jgi:hypothetical protein
MNSCLTDVLPESLKAVQCEAHPVALPFVFLLHLQLEEEWFQLVHHGALQIFRARDILLV